MRLYSVLPLLLISLPSLVNAGGYASSCVGISTVFGILHAKCNGRPGGKTDTAINLNDCFGNDDGQLAPQKRGNGLDSCQCSTMPDMNGEGVFNCNCNNEDQDRVRTSMKTNEVITNVDGVLSCHGIEGVCNRGC